jgi:two-component system sensor histidine kinase TctE
MPGISTGEALYVRVAETLHKREILAREALIYMIAPQLLVLGGIVLLVWHGVGRGIFPLNRIRDAISKRTHEDLSPLDETGLPAEVHEQVHVINDLMHRLGKTIAIQRRFVADATHQLRTPITVLRTQTELALRADDPGELRAIVKKLDLATARLARLANQLLNLSRAEAGLTGSLDFADIAVAEVVEDVVARLVPAALEKEIEIRVDIAEHGPSVRGDRQLLSEMLANLVDNAIRYTLAGGQIDINIRVVDGHTLWVVADNGPGIPEPDRLKVLERFYRGSDAPSEGSGLGLAIVHEIVALHGGSIDLASGAGGAGLQVTVDLPCAVSSPPSKFGNNLAK